MIESVSEIPVTSVFSLNATLYLFTMEVALGVEAYILEALAEPETLDEARETLVAYRARILRFLRVIAERRLTAWMAEAEADDNMPTLCMCHAYMALLWRNTPVEEMSVEAASKMIGHTAFVSHWHEFGNYPKAQADEGELETFERLRRFLGAHGIPTNRLTSSSLPGISGSLERILVLVIGRQSVRIDLRKYDPEVGCRVLCVYFVLYPDDCGLIERRFDRVFFPHHSPPHRFPIVFQQTRFPRSGRPRPTCPSMSSSKCCKTSGGRSSSTCRRWSSSRSLTRCCRRLCG